MILGNQIFPSFQGAVAAAEAAAAAAACSRPDHTKTLSPPPPPLRRMENIYSTQVGSQVGACFLYIGAQGRYSNIW